MHRTNTADPEVQGVGGREVHGHLKVDPGLLTPHIRAKISKILKYFEESYNIDITTHLQHSHCRLL